MITQQISTSHIGHVLIVVLIAVTQIKAQQWYDISKDDILSQTRFNTALSVADDANGNLVVVATLNNFGCSKAANAQNHFAVFLKENFPEMSGQWDRIRYTMEFRGSSACWSILGNMGYGNWGQSGISDLGLYEFNVDDGDVVIANSLTYGAWNGETRRCDNNAANFFHGQYGAGYKGSIRVEQRRNMATGNVGIGSGYSCTRVGSKVTYKNIQVQIPDPTPAPTSMVICVFCM